MGTPAPVAPYPVPNRGSGSMRRRSLPLLAALLAPAAITELKAQQWRSVSPVARTGQSFVFDLARARTVLFGGFTGGLATRGPALNDTWEYDGSSWQPIATVTSPPARTEHAMAYDLTRRRAILFGGFVNFTYL